MISNLYTVLLWTCTRHRSKLHMAFLICYYCIHYYNNYKTNYRIEHQNQLSVALPLQLTVNSADRHPWRGKHRLSWDHFATSDNDGVVLWPSSCQTCWHRSLLPAVREEEITLCLSHGAASEGRQLGDHLLSVTPGEPSGHAKGNAMRWYSSIPWADVYNWKKLKFSLQPRISMNCSRSGWTFIFFSPPSALADFLCD